MRERRVVSVDYVVLARAMCLEQVENRTCPCLAVGRFRVAGDFAPVAILTGYRHTPIVKPETVLIRQNGGIPAEGAFPWLI